MRHPLPRQMLLTAAAIAALSTTPAHADTLRDALSAAYETNPTLTAARSGQRATDENVPIARSDALPTITGTVDYSETVVQPSNSFFNPDRTLTLDGRLSVPLYRGGFVRNSVRAAQTRVESGQALLRATEAVVFNQVVAAYMEVISAEATAALSRNNVEVLTVNLQATRDRFDIGDLTRTDVAQSEARLALAQSQLQSAEARLISSRESYIQVVGIAPNALEAPPALPNLPATVDEAVETALADNPDLEAAMHDATASGFDVRAIRGLRLPSVSATAGTRYSDFLGSVRAPAAPSATSVVSGVTMTIPIFQGGETAARVRQAQARQSQAMERVIGTERSVIAQTRSAYARWQAANAVVASSQVAVDASRLSLEGVRAENSVGSRSILDILNAEQELLNAQVQLVTARRDAYIAGFTLLAAMGRGEAEDIGLSDGSTLYDPEANYRRVRGRIWDWDTDPTPQTVATRTANSRAQDASLPADAPATRP